jgi:hypothetical protein
VILHYIVDKPWERSVSADGVAGHLGRDGVTHQLWWDKYNGWLETQPPNSHTLQTMVGLVATEMPFYKK